MDTKVLMFGWELPPYNSGGLGVACLGLLKAMTSKGIAVTFVLPRKKDVEIDTSKFLFAYEIKVKFKTIDSTITPYATATSYKDNEISENMPYASNLMEEVRRYAMAAKKIAKLEAFDIIHAHDWLSFPAGIAAKEATGKP